MYKRQFGKFAGSQNKYITDTGCGASIMTAYPGNANGFNELPTGPYSGEHEYENSFKYISPNFNPGIRVWNSTIPEVYHPDLGTPGNSFIPRNDTREPLYSVDMPYNSYFTQPIEGLHNVYESFGMSHKNTRLIIHLLVIIALIYIVYYLYTKR